MKTEKVFILYAVLILFLGCNKSDKNKDFNLRGSVFGTTYSITYLNATDNYEKSLDSLFSLINKSVSTYSTSSDIYKINVGERNIVIDEIFTEVFKKSKKIYKETDGYFDPTVGNLVNAYGFGPGEENNKLTEADIATQMRFVGFDKVVLENGTIIKEHPRVYLDFNSIAKGFAVDVVARFLNDKKINNYLVEIGGEIRAKGTKENDKPWVIKLLNPASSDDTDGFKVIDLSNKSMATSGNYRKFKIDEDGKKYVHTINPKTGLATESNLLSASVIGSIDCADADAYATAFMAMGLEKTKIFLENHSELEVILLFLSSDGIIKEYTTYTYK